MFLYIVAGGSALLFVILCGLYEVLVKRRWNLGVVILLSGVAIPYLLGSIVYGVWVNDAYSRLLPFSWRLMSRQSGRTMLPVVYVLYLFLPLTVVVAGIGRILFWKRDKFAMPKARKDGAFSFILRAKYLSPTSTGLLQGRGRTSLQWPGRRSTWSCTSS